MACVFCFLAIWACNRDISASAFCSSEALNCCCSNCSLNSTASCFNLQVSSACTRCNRAIVLCDRVASSFDFFASFARRALSCTSACCWSNSSCTSVIIKQCLIFDGEGVSAAT